MKEKKIQDLLLIVGFSLIGIGLGELMCQTNQARTTAIAPSFTFSAETNDGIYILPDGSLHLASTGQEISSAQAEEWLYNHQQLKKEEK